MNGISVLLALSFALASTTACGEDQEELTEENIEFITDTVNLLGDCAGLFTFMAETFEFTKQPATARQMKDQANGARMAAAYMLSIEHMAKGRPPKKIGDFLIYPQGREDATVNRLRALFEQGDGEQIKAEQKRCIEALPMQNEIVQKMRDDMVGR